MCDKTSVLLRKPLLDRCSIVVLGSVNDDNGINSIKIGQRNSAGISVADGRAEAAVPRVEPPLQTSSITCSDKDNYRRLSEFRIAINVSAVAVASSPVKPAQHNAFHIHSISISRRFFPSICCC